MLDIGKLCKGLPIKRNKVTIVYIVIKRRLHKAKKSLQNSNVN